MPTHIRHPMIAAMLLAAVARVAAAHAATPECTVQALQAAAPQGMTIMDIPNVGPHEQLKTTQGVSDVAAGSLGDGAPEYCFVTGRVITNPTTNKTANFAAALPLKAQWNGKFMFQGCGGNCGTAFLGKPSAASLKRGYPIFATDDGHVNRGSPDKRLWPQSESSWAVFSPGHRDEDATTDFFYRAVHAVVLAGKELTRKYYAADNLGHSYYEGCSDGGREGMVEIARYPTDFDGVVAGDPYFDIDAEIVESLAGVQVQLRTASAAISHAQMLMIDAAVDAKCDAADGVKDHLIQDPGRCAFDPQKDLPRCRAGSSSNDCFSKDQLDSLSSIWSAITNQSGKPVYPAYPVSNVSSNLKADDLEYWLGFQGPVDAASGPEPWVRQPSQQAEAWYWANQTMRYLVYADEPGFNSLTTPRITFHASKEGSGLHAVIPDETVALVRRRVAAGNGNVPAESAQFFQQNRKLILYHGYSDGDITPFRTIQYYRDLAKLHGGYTTLQKNARLFMVPGMAHCGGGAGPNSFDSIAAIESWVEKGHAPASIIATKFDDDDPSGKVVRSMPLCPFPAMAHYQGKGDVNDAANWSCPATDRRLLRKGHAGQMAGLYADLK
jgi:Tannase and feruloyl esterase